MNVLQLQRSLSAWLKQGNEERAAAFPAAARDGLLIYLNNYRAQLSNCLEQSFPVTLAWLGDQAFRDSVVAHVEQVPPSHWTLDEYARDFPATLSARYPEDLEVAELATLELALADAFVVRDAVPQLSDIALVDWDRAIFEFIPSLSLHPVSTNAPAIWSAINDDEPPPPATILPREAAVLVWRTDETSRFRSIDQGERDALRFLAETGMTFADLCNSRPDEIGTIGEWLGHWLADGLIARIFLSAGRAAPKQTLKEY